MNCQKPGSKYILEKNGYGYTQMRLSNEIEKIDQFEINGPFKKYD